jgi:DNA-binding GntR family transcriptional regulator
MNKDRISQQIKLWDGSGNVAQNIAADLAISILASRLTELPRNESLAREWTVSERTVRRAKTFLAESGLIIKDETGRYYLPEAR